MVNYNFPSDSAAFLALRMWDGLIVRLAALILIYTGSVRDNLVIFGSLTQIF